jgi:hypothetical protein
MSSSLIFSKNSYSLKYFLISFIFSAICCFSLRVTPTDAAFVAAWELVMMLKTFEGCVVNYFVAAFFEAPLFFEPFPVCVWPALPRAERGLPNPCSLIPETSFRRSYELENNAAAFGSTPWERRMISGSFLNGSMKF